MSILPKPARRATGKARARRAAANVILPMPAATKPTRLNPVACDCCNRPVGYSDVWRGERDFPFGSLRYAMCYACSMQHQAGVPEDLLLSMLTARAGRFGQQWQDAVRSMLGWRA